jgi:Glycosyl transferase family 2.
MPHADSPAELLTVVMALKDRFPCTERWLAFATSMAFPFRIVICDGSLGDDAEKLFQSTSFPGLRISYRRFPPDTSYSAFYSKMLAALESVETPFVFLADNDDFLLPDALLKTVAFLREHPDHASAGARALRLTNLDGDGTPESLLYGKNLSLEYSPCGQNVGDDTPLERIRSALDNYYDWGWYNVMRTEIPLGVFRNAVSAKYHRLMFLEFALSAAAATHGKVRYDLAPFFVRQEGTSMGTSIDVPERFNILLTTVLPGWSDSVSELFDFYRSLAHVDKRTWEQAESRLREALARILYGMFSVHLQEKPFYWKLSRRIGLHRSLPWKAARSMFLAAKNWNQRIDPLGVQAARTRRLLRQNPEANQVIRFMANGTQVAGENS